jgi:hypothetical protein
MKKYDQSLNWPYFARDSLAKAIRLHRFCTDFVNVVANVLCEVTAYSNQEVASGENTLATT